MSTALRWTSADLAALPDDGKRYEIIDGELFMSKQPHWHHQFTCFQIAQLINVWNKGTQAGQVNFAPGIIFDDDDDVAPDVVWISKERRALLLGEDGKLHGAPELVVEVLSFSNRANEMRDREAKLKLYSRRGVAEYWMVNWLSRTVEIYRRERAALQLIGTFYATDTLETPLLPGFSCLVSEVFEDIPDLP